MKKVHFNPNVKIHHMFVWSFAYRKARISDFDRIQIMLDKFRFEIRKELLEEQLEKVGFFSRN